MSSPLAAPITGLLVAFGFVAASLADSPPQARGTAPPKPAPQVQKVADTWPPDAKTLESRRKAAEEVRLFARIEPLPITLTADFKAVMKERDPKSTKTFPATISYPNEDGTTATIPLQIRTRGHSRLLRQTCDFAPLRLEFPKDQMKKSMFEGYGPIKLGTHCRPVTEFEQYVLREYTVYRMFNLLTPNSYRARLVKATYNDSAQKKTIATKYAMFIEDDDELAKRMVGRVLDRQGLLFHNVDPDMLMLMTIFEYMIGNTDMSMKLLHNITLIQKPDNSTFAIPYDFDYSGLVDASYAVPDTKQLGIQSVRDRLYRGPCKTAAELEPYFAKFRAAKADLMGLFDALPDMNPGYARDAKKYLEDFYKTIDRPGSVKSQFIDNCDNRRGM
jgi:hypothetical protein